MPADRLDIVVLTNAQPVGVAEAIALSFQVVNTGGALAVKLGPKPDRFAMSHDSGHVFSYQPAAENAYGLSGVTFTVGRTVKATMVTVEHLDSHDLGTFIRVEPTGS